MIRQTIVILHGWGLCGKVYTPLKKELLKHGFKIFTPDLPGFGSLQAVNQPLSLTDYARFLRNYLADRHLSNIVLIGHSFGGRVALKFNELYPQFSKAIILTGTPGFSSFSVQKYVFLVLLAKLGNAFLMMPPFFYFRKQIRGWYYYLIGARDYYRANEVMRETFKKIIKESLVLSMQTVRKPCLLIWGENDVFVSVRIAQKMLKEIRNSKLIVIPGVGHGLPFKQPKIFSQKIRPFLETI